MRKGSLDAQSKLRIQVGIAILALVVGAAALSGAWAPPPLQETVLVGAITPAITTQ